MPADAETIEAPASTAFQAGDPCPIPNRRWVGPGYGAGSWVNDPCAGVMEPGQRMVYLGSWGADRRVVKLPTWRCTRGHLICEGPGCREQQPPRYNARYHSSACRLRAWRQLQRLTSAVSGGAS